MDSNQGISVLHTPAQGRHEVDILFVHGLRGHRLNTWSKGSCCWPRDILPEDMPQARVMTFGYDTSAVHLAAATSQNSIFGHVENLLVDLKNERRTANAGTKPLIFVGHSLGGLVIKQALIRSKEYFTSNQDLQLGSIGESTLGVIFLATPHRGSDTVRFADVIYRAAKLTGNLPNEHLLNALRKDSDVLEAQRASFATISKDMPIKCIYEELATMRHMIVGESSAVIDGFHVRKASIQADHIAICKFDSPDDGGYKKVKNFLLDMYQEGKVTSNFVLAKVDRQVVSDKRIKKFEPYVQSTTTTAQAK